MYIQLTNSVENKHYCCPCVLPQWSGIQGLEKQSGYLIKHSIWNALLKQQTMRVLRKQECRRLLCKHWGLGVGADVGLCSLAPQKSHGLGSENWELKLMDRKPSPLLGSHTPCPWEILNLKSKLYSAFSWLISECTPHLLSGLLKSVYVTNLQFISAKHPKEIEERLKNDFFPLE